MAIEHGGNGSWRKRKLVLKEDNLSSGQGPGCLFSVLESTGIDRYFLQEGLLFNY